jgi:hypothetical protein
MISWRSLISSSYFTSAVMNKICNSDETDPQSNTFDEQNLLRGINPDGKVMRLNCLRSYEIGHKDRGSDYLFKKFCGELTTPTFLEIVQTLY